jgi:HSP20 family protein
VSIKPPTPATRHPTPKFMPRQHIFFSDLAALEQQINQLFEGTRHAEQPSRTSWSPAVDIYETANSFVLTAEVPGVSSDEIDVKVVDNQLTLRGERRWDREGAEKRGEQFHRLESAYGKFERSFNLSERIDIANISASLEQGVLTVKLPKRVPKVQRIEIEME